MERFAQEKENAKRYILIADHMLTQTYPLLGEAKILLSVVDNIYRSAISIVRSALYYERMFKRIPPFSDENESIQIDAFKRYLMTKYNLEKKYINILEAAKEILLQHKKSPVEFARKDKFIICSDKYHIKTVTTKELKEFISDIKIFIQKVDAVVSKHERIFNRSN